jgi:hypothetical protein
MLAIAGSIALCSIFQSPGAKVDHGEITVVNTATLLTELPARIKQIRRQYFGSMKRTHGAP